MIGLLGIASIVELLFRGAAAVRWRLSLFLIFAGAGGAVLGVAIDLLTSSISPAYFEVGKGLAAGAGFTARIARMGAQAGASAGAIIGCALLIAGTVGKSPSSGAVARFTFGVPVTGLMRALLAPLLVALSGGVVGTGVGLLVAPEHAPGDILEQLASAEVRPFLVVWSTHAGIYAGALVGTVVGAITVSRRRRRSAGAGVSDGG